MVAREHVAVVFDHHAFAAELGCDAALRRQSHGLRDRRFEEVDVYLAVIAGVPEIPDLAQKRTPVVRVHRPVGHHRVWGAGLGLRRADDRDRARIPALRSNVAKDFRLDARDELHTMYTEFAGEKPVHVERMFGVLAVDHTQRVERHAVFLQQTRGGHHFGVGRWSALGDPVTIVQLLRAVTAQTDEEIVLFEKRGPFVIEQRAVGLEIVLDDLPRLLVLASSWTTLRKKSPEQRRLAALPREHHFIAGLRLDVLADVLFKHFVGHPRRLSADEATRLYEDNNNTCSRDYTERRWA